MNSPADRTRVVAAARAVAHDVLRALALDPAGIAAATRVSECSDSLGQTTGEVFGQYDTGAAVANGAVSDDQLDELATVLGATVLDDFRQQGVGNEPGARLIVLTATHDDIPVRATVRLADDGSFSLGTETDCT